MNPRMSSNCSANAWTPSAPLPEPNSFASSCFPTTTRLGVIGEYWANPKTRTFAELLLIDAEESREIRAVLVGMLREP